MKINTFIHQMVKKNNNQFFIFVSFIIFFLIGLSIFKDFGLSNDEPFQRTIGYYWLIDILKKFSSNYELINQIDQKFQLMYWSEYVVNGNLLQYGVLFDTFAASLEEIFNINNNQDAFHLKHFLTFISFFISSIFFYKIINQRFKNHLFALLVTFFYISSPRIFAESFYNCKDIVFMSFVVISLHYALRSFENFSLKNIFFFSLFTAFATNVRVMGVFLFFLFLFFLFFSSLEEKRFFKKNINKFCYLIIFYTLITFIFWPFLWESPVNNFIFALKSFANFNMSFEIFYLGEFYNIKNLPWHYIPIWIFVTTPLIFFLFFIIGFLNVNTLFFKNFCNISNKNRLWNNVEQKKDFFILFFFITPIFLVIFLNSTLYTGWRHLYFIYPCLTYFIALGLKFIFKETNLKTYKKMFGVIVGLSLILNIYNLIKLHPYQNIYFNFIVEHKARDYFEIDYWGLGNVEALAFLNEQIDDEKINLKVASFSPFEYSRLIHKNSSLNKFSFIGTSEKDLKYIFTNYIFDKNPKYEKKYFIPKNYDKIFVLKKGNIIINEIYKKR